MHFTWVHGYSGMDSSGPGAGLLINQVQKEEPLPNLLGLLFQITGRGIRKESAGLRISHCPKFEGHSLRICMQSISHQYPSLLSLYIVEKN